MIHLVSTDLHGIELGGGIDELQNLRPVSHRLTERY